MTTVFPKNTLTGLVDGAVVGGLQVTTRRDAVALVPDADTATAPCSYTVGAVAPAPTSTAKPRSKA